MTRTSAEDRRESVIRAAIAEFGRCGYHGTSTKTIAERVGVSQPYLFRLFPGKKAIFLAAIQRCMDELVCTFQDAAAGLTGGDALHSMAHAYTTILAERPELLLLQMQMYVAVAAAEGAGDREVGEAVRSGWMRLWDTVHLSLGADTDETTRFLAHGMLINCLVSMGFVSDSRGWQSTDPVSGWERPQM
ncbi:TetR/AcrR family transcriptional regulator [Streptomyces griseorubiginosus]|uniref:TetR/AcrR family transcriptional regulator n=1 Tax=Streptomyces griseorubiginosus TaxID=67304 RepID=UPI00340862E5